MPTYWNQQIRHWSLTFLLVASTLLVFGQDPTDNSPYSRYGVGDLVSTDFGALNALGGISSAYYNRNSLNISNPASLGFIQSTAFEVGLYSDFSWLEAASGDGFAIDGNLTHIALGFPIKNPINKLTEIKKSKFNWGTAFGLLPYSRVGYSIETQEVIPNIDTVFYEYNGSGGLYQLFLSNGVSYKNTAVGFTAGYLFGNIAQERVAVFPDVDNAFSNILTNKTNHKGFIYNIGVQHEFILGAKNEKEDASSALSRRNKTRLIIGATANNTMEVAGSSRSLNRRYSTFYGFDTIVSDIDNDGSITLPLEYSLGFTLSKDNKWLVGVDYSAARWSEYNSPFQSDTLANTFRIGFGAEYVPDANAYNKYLKRVAYRIGGFYELDPRIIDGEQLATFGLNAGFGFPITLPKKGTVAYSNISFEYGRLGYNTAIGETYLKVKAAFTLNDNSWFYKRKFD